MESIRDRLYALAEEPYREFTAGLIPTINRESVLGVRIPELRKIAKDVVRRGEDRKFLSELPHQYYEENQIHSFILDYGNYTFDETLQYTEEFLPYIDNWAVCDSFKPKALRKEPEKLLEHISDWLGSSEDYTVRYGFVLLLNWYLEENFRREILDAGAEVRSESYYVIMGAAWFFSMALAKQYQETVIFLEERRLSPEIHNKTIQKAIESRQINGKIKEYLRTLRIPAEKNEGIS